MEELQYILAQRIGVFYKNQMWRRDMFDKIAGYYCSIDMIESLTYSMWNARIVLIDGTVITFVEADNRSRSCRFSKVIIQPEVNQAIIDGVIRPCLPFASTQCYVVDIYDNKIEHI